MKYLLLIFAFYINDLKAQKVYSIEFSQFVQSNITINGQYHQLEMKSRLVYNDTISFYYLIPQGKKDKLKKEKILGDKLIHHGMIYNRNTDELLLEVAWPKDKYFIIVDSLKSYNWIFNNEKKRILGYNCNLAYLVSETNDSTLVWYTSALGSIFGPSAFFGLPGVVLEVIGQRNGIHYLATKIKTTTVTLVLPEHVKKIPIEAYRKEKSSN